MTASGGTAGGEPIAEGTAAAPGSAGARAAVADTSGSAVAASGSGEGEVATGAPKPSRCSARCAKARTRSKLAAVTTAGPVVEAIFQWKTFDEQSAFYTTVALRFYAPGLLVFSLWLVEQNMVSLLI